MKDNDKWDWKGPLRQRFNWRTLKWENGRWCFNTNGALSCAWEWEYETTDSIIVTRNKRTRRIYAMNPSRSSRRRDFWGTEYACGPSGTWITDNGKIWVAK